MPGILNFGSLNIDYVYRVAHITQPGETQTGQSFETFAGGKGANQSVAIARAGGSVVHAGCVGEDGRWLVDSLQDDGVDISLISVTGDKTGHAIIQVDDAGENAIFLYPGTNRKILPAHVDRAIQAMPSDSFVLVQNEINCTAQIMRAAAARGLRVCVNPAPFAPPVRDWPWECVDVLIVNETEAMGLAQCDDAGTALKALVQTLDCKQIILTRGSRGLSYRAADCSIDLLAHQANAVDTTAAGDTFIGYFLASLAKGLPIQACLQAGQKAAAICVSRPGAIDSIPLAGEV